MSVEQDAALLARSFFRVDVRSTSALPDPAHRVYSIWTHIECRYLATDLEFAALAAWFKTRGWDITGSGVDRALTTSATPITVMEFTR